MRLLQGCCDARHAVNASAPKLRQANPRKLESAKLVAASGLPGARSADEAEK